jgi:hypothetical protein
MANPLRQASEPFQPKRSQEEICRAANERMLMDPDGRRDIQWVIVGGQMKLEWKRQLGGPA